MEYQHHQPERSASPVSPIVPSHSERDIPQLQTEQDTFRSGNHEPIPQLEPPAQTSFRPAAYSAIPSTPPPAYLPGPPAYTPSTTSSSPDPEKATTATPPSASRKRTLFGIAAFLLLLTICIIVGVTVGRATKSHKHHVNTSATSTLNMPSPSTPSTSPSSKPVTSGTVGIAANDCTTHSRAYTVDARNTTATFTSNCAADIPADVVVEVGTRPVKDLRVTTAYTFEECMSACAERNAGAQDGGGILCVAVSYNANLTEAFGGGGEGNCFLKDSLPKTMSPTGGLRASARLEMGGVAEQGEPGVDVDG
ncbi:uncharacterized protein BDZ99DRAFT_517465 [Mytilinidion resinicola]|uniref:Apple domain-containing protein n=1 Tax=Mytilinidion resinicola TaxID=574789 RepID=A0A6A6YWK4_9PEZI|nr:uncharacterized protein BDZ99DRAFT_517465 [Mytilinidion resinicola]KAF2813181.1 hypothetical protein BDZ99DRAFT_517465 [Mytilinidion resinicola]